MFYCYAHSWASPYGECPTCKREPTPKILIDVPDDEELKINSKLLKEILLTLEFYAGINEMTILYAEYASDDVQRMEEDKGLRARAALEKIKRSV